MQFNTKLALLAVLASCVVAQNEGAGNGTAPATNGTAPATNGTVLDDGSAGNSTVLDDGSAGNSTLPSSNSTTPATNGTATNGTTTNGTSTTNGTNGTTTNGTSPSAPEPSSGSTRRSLAACEYECPQLDLASHVLLLSTLGDDGTFTCTFASGACTYQTETGVLNDDQNGGQCRSGAVTYTPGCLAGDANNGGVVKRRASKHRRSSREMQYEAIARRFLL